MVEPILQLVVAGEVCRDKLLELFFKSLYRAALGKAEVLVVSIDAVVLVDYVLEIVYYGSQRLYLVGVHLGQWLWSDLLFLGTHRLHHLLRFSLSPLNVLELALETGGHWFSQAVEGGHELVEAHTLGIYSFLVLVELLEHVGHVIKLSVLGCLPHELEHGLILLVQCPLVHGQVLLPDVKLLHLLLHLEGQGVELALNLALKLLYPLAIAHCRGLVFGSGCCRCILMLPW